MPTDPKKILLAFKDMLAAGVIEVKLPEELGDWAEVIADLDEEEPPLSFSNPSPGVEIPTNELRESYSGIFPGLTNAVERYRARLTDATVEYEPVEDREARLHMAEAQLNQIRRMREELNVPSRGARRDNWASGDDS